MITVSLVITTYNWKEALGAVLESVKDQTLIPNEVIIADDGSREDTQHLIDNYRSDFPCDLVHSWQEDQGFRLSMSRNRAIAKATSQYIIMIDGDIVMPAKFIEDHVRLAKKNWFIQGGRVQVGPELSESIIRSKASVSLFSKDIRNRKNTISNPWLGNLFSYKRNNDTATRGCNLSFWKGDVIQANGFNEDFEGWGREDSEFVIRMLNRNVNRLYMKFSGAGYHLYHNENARASLGENEEIFENTINAKLTRCENGIDKYLKGIK